ncbi:MAG: hypothetical protein ACRCWB_11655 [Enterovibrio sp.]
MTKENTVTQEFLAANVPVEFQDNTLINLYEKVKTEVCSEVQDVTTVDGRKAIRDNVQKVTATRNAIDEQLRNYLRELKTLPKIVEKSARENLQRYNDLGAELLAGMKEAYAPQQETLDTLDSIKKSCDSFTLRSADLEKTLQEVESIDVGLFWPEHKAKARKKIKETLEVLTAKHQAAVQAEAHQAELEKARAEKEAAEREALAAKIAADEKIKAQLAIERAAIEAQQAVERAKIEAEEAKQRAAMQHELELKKAQQAALMAAQIEHQKMAAQQAAEKAAAEKRAADQENRIAKNREALADFIEQGFDEATAKKVITLIAQRKIKNIVINY